MHQSLVNEYKYIGFYPIINELSLNLYFGTSRLRGAGPLRIRPEPS